MKVLVLNAGSSTQKSCLYEIGGRLPADPPKPLWEAHTDGERLKISTAQGTWDEAGQVNSRGALRHMLESIWTGPGAVLESRDQIEIVGHRVVHGGREYRDRTKVTAEVKEAIGRLAELAPSHNPPALQGIEAVEELLGQVPQVAVFDTAFHADLPDAAAVYPGPYEWAEAGIRRYGFHGINHKYCAGRTAQILGSMPERLITCHLGNGCSLAAIRNGHCVDTTMGFTPLEGLMMGTRSGSIDPGILTYLLRHKGYSADELDELLNKNSGLKGLSGISHDMREIEAGIREGNSRAELALEVYLHRLRYFIGALTATLGGLDALVFTAGVGENCPLVRSRVCAAFDYLGLKIDEEQNTSNSPDRDLAVADSKVRVLLIAAQEDWAIAREAWSFLTS